MNPGVRGDRGQPGGKERRGRDVIVLRGSSQRWSETSGARYVPETFSLGPSEGIPTLPLPTRTRSLHPTQSRMFLLVTRDPAAGGGRAWPCAYRCASPGSKLSAIVNSFITLSRLRYTHGCRGTLLSPPLSPNSSIPVPSSTTWSAPEICRRDTRPP